MLLVYVFSLEITLLAPLVGTDGLDGLDCVAWNDESVGRFAALGPLKHSDGFPTYRGLLFSIFPMIQGVKLEAVQRPRCLV